MAEMDVSVILRLVDKLSSPIKQTASNMRKFSNQMDGVGKQMRAVGRSASLRVTAPLTAIGYTSIKTAAEFERAMQGVDAILQGTQQEFKKLEDKALELGSATKFTATQAAEGIEMLARNGMNAQTILGGAADATLLLADAAGGDMSSSADVLTDIMSNMKVQASDLGKVVDNISGTLAKSKMDWQQYQDGLLMTLGSASAVGMGIEDVNVALAATAPLFKSGSVAGTSMNMFLMMLAKQSKEGREAMKELGLEFWNADGSLKSLENLSEQLKAAKEGATDEKFLESMALIFGSRSSRTAFGLAQQGAEGIANFRKEIGSVSAEEMRSRRQKGFYADLTRLKSAWEALTITFYKNTGALKSLTSGLQRVTGFVRDLSNTSPAMMKWVAILGTAAAAFGPFAIGLGFMVSALGKLLKPLSYVVSGLGKFATLIRVVAAVNGTSSAAAAISLLASSFKVLGSALLGLSLNPVTLGLAALAATGYAVWKNWDIVSPALEKVGNAASNILSHFKPLAGVLGSIAKAAGLVSFGSMFDGWDKGVAGGVVSILESIASALEKINSMIEAIKNADLFGAVDNLFGGLRKLSPSGMLNDVLGIGEMVDGALTQKTDPKKKGPARGIAAANDGQDWSPATAGIRRAATSAKQVSALHNRFKAAALRNVGSDVPATMAANAPVRGAAPLSTAASRNANAASKPVTALHNRFKEAASKVAGSDVPAGMAAASPMTGAPVPAGITIEANGPEVHVNQAPPAVNVAVSVYVQSPDQAPAATADAVGRAIGAKVSAGMYDGVNE